MPPEDDPPKHKKINRTRIAVTVILGTLILGFVILGTVLLSGQPPTTNRVAAAQAQHRNIHGIELEEVLYGGLNPQRFNATFVSDTEVLYRNEARDIVLLDIIKKESKVLVPGNFPILESAISYELSADRKYLLVAHTSQKLYRYSFISHYDILDLENRKNIPLTSTGGNRLHLLAQWGPEGNAIAFVAFDTHDIFYKATVQSPAWRVTTNGAQGVMYNGVPDWVNEEEIFSSNKAIWFSKDGKQLAFARFNDSHTQFMSIPFYGLPGDLNFQYTRAINIRYPKPGTRNPVVTLHVATLGASGIESVNELPVPQELSGGEPILSSVTWATKDQLAPVWMNRVQNESYIALCEISQNVCRNILTLKEPKGWVTLTTPPKFSADGTKMILVLPQKQDNGDEFRHICLATKGANGEFQVSALTSGRLTVTEVLDYNEKDGNVMYTAIEDSHQEIQHIYQISTTDEDAKPMCITCKFRNRLQKRPCLSNSAEISTKASLYAHFCQGPGVPEVIIRDSNDNEVLVWEDNRKIYDDIRSRQLPIIERLRVPLPDGFSAHVALHLPPDIDRSAVAKYPLLISVYGGPDTAQDNEKFTIDWNTYLTVNKSFIYATIDGRGSGNKGNKMLFSIYRRLGSYEVEDQINATRYIQSKFPFIDSKRTAIWGWSYGGYATAMALAKDVREVFKCGISVAPVTDWAYYDTIYTERFMGIPIPSDNKKGYDMSRLTDKVENLRKKQFYLVHGTLDDNVHYQQSMMLSKVLEHNDILFRSQTYPDEEHGLSQVRPHLYHSLEKFLDECFTE